MPSGTDQANWNASENPWCDVSMDVLRQMVSTLNILCDSQKGTKHERKSISRNLFIFGPMLIGTFLLILGWGIPRKSLWHRFWNTLYVPSESTQPHHSQWKILGWRLRCSDLLDSQRKSYIRSKLKINNIAENWKAYEKNWLDYLKRTKIGSPIQSQGTMEFRTTWAG